MNSVKRNRIDRPCAAADRRSILLITEDARIADLVSEALECHGFSVSCESNVGQAVGRGKNGNYCLVLADVRALLRRTDSCGHAVQVGNLRLDPGARVVLADSHRIDCTSIEYDILEYLARQAGQVVSRDKLVLDVCGRHATPFDRALDVHISHLRRKLRHAGQRIVTVRGIGYMLAATAADGAG